LSQAPLIPGYTTRYDQDESEPFEGLNSHRRKSPTRVFNEFPELFPPGVERKQGQLTEKEEGVGSLMYFRKNLFSMFATLVVSLTVFTTSFAQVKETTTFPEIKIKNFGQMDEKFYRGAQPKEGDFKALSLLGIKTIIDLRETPKAYEKSAVEALGMKYVNIPMKTRKYPTPGQIEAFMKQVEDASTGPFFVHCAGGRHRTGIMGAVYRFEYDGWDYEKVFAEMKRYDFYSRWGHGPMKEFVKDYWEEIQTP
jgi:protein tyrosine phosphatase (PTP) superfamily phosphohydrolase (DUF442 family)